MSASETFRGSASIGEAHRRLEQMKEAHKQAMFEERDAQEPIGPNGLSTESFTQMMSEERHRTIADVCEEIQDFFPEPEPMEVRRYRALVLSMDTVRNSADLRTEHGDPLLVMQSVAREYRDTALGAIENRLILEKPTDEEDAEVIYIYDPVSKLRRTTALGGYRKEYDEAWIEGQKKQFAEQVLNDVIPDSIPRV